MILRQAYAIYPGDHIVHKGQPHYVNAANREAGYIVLVLSQGTTDSIKRVSLYPDDSVEIWFKD